MKSIIFDRVYDGNSIHEVADDIFDFDDSEIPKDEHGLMLGEFRVIIEFMEEMEEEEAFGYDEFLERIGEHTENEICNP